MNESIIPIPKNSLEKLLKPVNRLTECCVLRSNGEFIYTLCSSIDNGVILYANTKTQKQLPPIKLNIISIKKLLTGLECLGNDGDFSLSVNVNNITCTSSDEITKENTRFKYHLVEDNIIKESTVDLSMVAQLGHATVFELSLSKIKQIMSAYSFVNDINKIYFYTKDGKVYAEIDDKGMQNIDNVSLMVSPSFVGESTPKPLAVKIEIFKLLASSKTSIKVKINNEYNVFIFETQEDENTQLKYIVSTLVN